MINYCCKSICDKGIGAGKFSGDWRYQMTASEIRVSTRFRLVRTPFLKGL